MQKYAKICKNMQKYAKICKNIQNEYFWINEPKILKSKKC